MPSGYCEHGFKMGLCECTRARKIETLNDAKAILESRKASYVEWRECAEIFASFDLHDQAAECTIFAIESLGGRSQYETKIRFSLATYLHHVLKKMQTTSARQNLADLAVWLFATKEAVNKDKEKFYDTKGHSKKILDEANKDLAEAIILVKDGSKVSLTKLASKFRLPRPKDKALRWGLPDLALLTINRVLKQYPDDTHALVSRASIYADLKKFEHAERDANRAVELLPEDSVTLVTLGNILILRHRGFQAWPHLLKAWDLKPSIPIKAMLFIACAVAMQYQAVTGAQERLIMSWRSWVFAQSVADDPDEILKEQRATFTATVRMLIRNGDLKQAVLALAEFQNENWGGMTERLYSEILEAAILLDITDIPTLDEAMRMPRNYYPDMDDLR